MVRYGLAGFGVRIDAALDSQGGRMGDEVYIDAVARNLDGAVRGIGLCRRAF